ncbi:MAG TPA: penicillin-binding transpeptidase domain-containing protein [Pseudobdellovibrionaceae bacterium]|nr:penicillin-binding transpeptidase domain-containing protein [Pseudobdellovibrionaceae bacterium]
MFFGQKPNDEEIEQLRLKRNLERRVNISKALEEPLKTQTFPETLSVRLDGDKEDYRVEYTLDPILQRESELLLKRYRPDYGAIFLMDAETGEVLAFSSYEKAANGPVNLISRATYPSASIFKIVTATAAVDGAGLSPSHTIRFNGGNYTLYRKNVMSDRINRWTRAVTLRDAFARSYNTAFGRLSLEELSPEDINEYATRYMFNQTIPADFPVESGVALIPTEKSFELTEAASGFTRNNRMRPVQGAMIAAAVINNGRMVMPHLVKSMKTADGEPVYEAEIIDNGSIMSASSSEKVRELMEETIVSGTSRRSFRPLVRDRNFRDLEMGGKTGHLTGDNPRGRVDWFVGYASSDSRKIAVAALTVNKEYWTVKSAHLGKSLFKKAFEPTIKNRDVSSTPNGRSRAARHRSR